jgi:hypothetical protein
MRMIQRLAPPLVLAVLVIAPSTLVAQTAAGADNARIANTATLEAVVTGHESAAERTRAGLLEILADDEVRAIADARGIDLERARAGAMTLPSGEMAGLSSLVEEATAALAQRNTITISVYTVIIILLILILIT